MNPKKREYFLRFIKRKPYWIRLLSDSGSFFSSTPLGFGQRKKKKNQQKRNGYA
jgi:hypothetical protein